MSQSPLVTYKFTFHYDILILFKWNMNEYVHKCYYNETAKMYWNQMAGYVTAICTARPNTKNYKNKSNQMIGSYKYIYLLHYCELGK